MRDGVTIFACGPRPRCERCSRPATTECTYPLRGRFEGHTCGRRLCRWCAVQGDDRGPLCPAHARVGGDSK